MEGARLITKAMDEGLLMGMYGLFVEGKVPVKEIIQHLSDPIALVHFSGDVDLEAVEIVVDETELPVIVETAQTVGFQCHTDNRNLIIVVPLWNLGARLALSYYESFQLDKRRIYLKLTEHMTSYMFCWSTCYAGRTDQNGKGIVVWENGGVTQ